MAARDVNGDGIADIIAVRDAGNYAEAAIFNGLTAAELARLFFYDPTSSSGGFVG